MTIENKIKTLEDVLKYDTSTDTSHIRIEMYMLDRTIKDLEILLQ